MTLVQAEYMTCKLDLNSLHSAPAGRMLSNTAAGSAELSLSLDMPSWRRRRLMCRRPAPAAQTPPTAEQTIVASARQQSGPGQVAESASSRRRQRHDKLSRGCPSLSRTHPRELRTHHGELLRLDQLCRLAVEAAREFSEGIAVLRRRHAVKVLNLRTTGQIVRLRADVMA